MAVRAFCDHPFSLKSPSLPPSYPFPLASSSLAFGRLSGCFHSRPLISAHGASSATQNCRFQFAVHALADVAEVSAPVASDGLTMNLKIEGTIADSLVPKVTDALKKIEGISNLKVYTSEGIATVELSKQTTIQATGEASSLLETIQGEGFKLQNLSICFDDPSADADEDIAYEYETS